MVDLPAAARPRLPVIALVAVFGLLLLAMPRTASADGAVDQQNLISTGTLAPIPLLVDDQYFGQLFQPSRWGYLDRITVGLVVPSQLTLTMYVRELKAESDGSYSKQILAQATTTVQAGGSCDQQSVSLVPFEFTQPALVRPDRQYVLHVDIGSYDSRACIGAPNPYQPGRALLVFDNGPVTPGSGTPGAGPDGIALFVLDEGLDDLVFQTFVDTEAYLDAQFALLQQQVNALPTYPKLLVSRFLPGDIRSPLTCLKLRGMSLAIFPLKVWLPAQMAELEQTIAQLNLLLRCPVWPPRR